MAFTSGIELHHNFFYMNKNARTLNNNCQLPAIVLAPRF